MQVFTFVNPCTMMLRNSSVTSPTIFVAGSLSWAILRFATTSNAAPGVKSPTFTPLVFIKNDRSI